MDNIVIKGARENNLKNINITLPKNKLIVMTGVSGSGKSSLAFDTIYAEGQRRYVESLSAYARQFLGGESKPLVDSIEGLSPSISIDQKTTHKNPRSTVGTYTEIYTYLRLLYSRVGTPSYDSSCFSFNTPKGACLNCGGLGIELVVDLDKLIDFNLSLNEGAIKHRTWKVESRYFNIQKSTNFFDMDKKLKDYNKKELDLLLYQKPVNFTYDTLEQNQTAYLKLLNRIQNINPDGELNSEIFKKYDDKFKECLENDLGTSNAITLLYDLIKDSSVNNTTKLELIKSWDTVLSLDLIQEKQNQREDHDDIMRLINERNEAKKNKDFAKADEIRDNLLQKGIMLVDTREGTTYKEV